MATSQNGWRAGTRAELGIKTFTVPGSRVRLPLFPGPSATVLLYVASRFDREVENIDTETSRGYSDDHGSLVADDWGYAERVIRGSSTTLSNHASGTAIDLNATQHPLSKRGTFSPRQYNAIRRILADVDFVIRWGGDYINRADEMHFEINKGYAAVKRVADRIERGGTAGSRIPNLEDDVATLVKGMGPDNAAVAAYQKGLLAHNAGLLPDYGVDGHFGDETEAATRIYQQHADLPVTGQADPTTVAYVLTAVLRH